jgi:acyl dehydratase
MTTKLDYASLADHVGESLGSSDWFSIDQARVQAFADATEDHQWIHLDQERAKSGPFGTTIAHGYLTLALFPRLYREVVEFSGVGMTVNYGADKLRFTGPVPVGSKVRLNATLKAVEPKAGGQLATIGATIEVEGAERPAIVSDILFLLYPK